VAVGLADISSGHRLERTGLRHCHSLRQALQGDWRSWYKGHCASKGIKDLMLFYARIIRAEAGKGFFVIESNETRAPQDSPEFPWCRKSA
jgi:hypothetical protein